MISRHFINSTRCLLFFAVISILFAGCKYSDKKEIAPFASDALETCIGIISATDTITENHLYQLFKLNGINCVIEGSVICGISVRAEDKINALNLLKNDRKNNIYWLVIFENGKKTHYPVTDKDWTVISSSKKYNELILLPEFAPSTDVGSLLRSENLKDDIAKYPFVREIKTIKREYLDENGKIQVGHDVEIELALRLKDDIAGKRARFQIWDSGKMIQPLGSNEWFPPLEEE